MYEEPDSVHHLHVKWENHNQIFRSEFQSRPDGVNPSLKSGMNNIYSHMHPITVPIVSILNCKLKMHV